MRTPVRVVAMGFTVAMFAVISGAWASDDDARRLALVIGNGGYQNVPPLTNPPNDARLISRTLKAAGFTLIGGGPQVDLDKPHFDRLVQEFGRRITGADVAMFYYAGHGMQVGGENWLVPTDANPSTTKDLDFQMVGANLVLRQMEDAGTKLNLVVLDACRNNPFSGRGLRGAGGGLAEMHAPEGTIISYATQPGNVAADGSGDDSPYTLALVDAIKKPGLDIFHVFNDVGLSVKRGTAGVQQPWLASSPISGSFFFLNNGPVTVTVAAPPPPPVNAPRFDGVWSVTVSCIAENGANSYDLHLPAQVHDGVLHGETGHPQKPGWYTLDGTINADGSTLLHASGLTGSTDFIPSSYKTMGTGASYAYDVQAHFTETTGTGTRLGKARHCALNFVRN